MRHHACLGILAIPLFATLAFAANGAAIRGRIGPFPDGLGVNIHFTESRPGEMKMLADAGFKWVRMDFAWGGTERKKGEYDFSAYDRLMSALDEYHIHPVFILDYSNRNYDDDQSPHTDEGRAAFAKWAVASATHFKGRGVIWEMYNEPNIGFWRPKPNVDDYAKLALAVGKALRDATPDEPYIGPGCSTMDFKFLEACFKAGCLEYWAAVSCHPYRQTDPETVVADYAKLRGLIKQYAPAGKNIPIISSEWGYSSGWKKFDEGRQARYLPRELLVNVASGVPISIWYDWHDDGDNPNEPEHHFGTVHHEYHKGREEVYDPKPAYLAMKAMSDALKGSTFERRVAVGSDADWVLAFNHAGAERYAVWTTGKPHDVRFPAPAGAYYLTSLGKGQGEALTAGSNGLTIEATGAPQYLFKPAHD
jgi:polysaccharide biosynthesis protein PslG